MVVLIVLAWQTVSERPISTAILAAARRRGSPRATASRVATVIETWGSAPRRVGSHLAVRDDGLFEGSVSGGCVEGDVIVAADRHHP